jgi:hypothetical protein
MHKKLLTGLAAIALAGTALTTMSATTANAASTECGASCMTFSSELFGSGYVVAAVTSRFRLPFQPPGVALAPAGPYESEDFKPVYLASVSTLYSYGIVSAAVDRSWPDDIGYEYLYAPGGVESTLCLGTAGIAAQGTPVTLQPCGVSGQTVWIATASRGEFTPLVNGTDNRSFAPYVLTASTDNGPLTVQEFIAIISRTPPKNQLWQEIDGVISYPLPRKPAGLPAGRPLPEAGYPPMQVQGAQVPARIVRYGMRRRGCEEEWLWSAFSARCARSRPRPRGWRR